jgi:ribosomal protein L32
MRHTSSHTKNRRSHHALKGTTILKDEEKGTMRLPHRMDEATGTYRGKQVIPASTLKRREARAERLSKRVEQKPELENVPARSEVIHSEKEEKKEGMLGRFTKGRANSRSGTGS